MDHRSRLLEGMAHAVAAKGYGDTTLADIVAAANVSRRTFYEHFSDKAECLLALFEQRSNRLTDRVRNAIDLRVDGPQQISQAVAAYLDTLAQHPELLRTVFMDILSLGDRGRAVRRLAYERLADRIMDMARNHAAQTGRETVLSRQMAMAAVGGINELILVHTEQGRADRLHELHAPACALLMAVVQSPSCSAASNPVNQPSHPCARSG